MTIDVSSFVKDLVFFIKNDLSNNLTDPLFSVRNSQSKFVLTSYPHRLVDYPIITIKVPNYTAKSAGLATNAMDFVINIEIRVWARNIKEKEDLATSILNRLINIQFTTITGSVANYLYKFNLSSAVEIDEEGDNTPKSRILNIQYKFFS